jgi:hypothetical protein
MTLVSLLLCYVLIGVITMLIPIAWVLVDACLIPGLARAANDRPVETPA